MFVHPGRLGQPAEVDIGDNVDAARIVKPTYAGLPAGWYMIRSEEDWALLFADFPSRPLPPTVDFNNTMILGGYSGSSEATALQVTKVIRSADAIHVYAMQTSAGEGCPRLKGTPPPFDMVSLARSDKPIHIHADTERGVTCDGGGPKGGVVCRSASSPKWAVRGSVQLGDQVECQAQNEAWSSNIVDQSVLMSEIPKGSAAKLTFDGTGMRVRFPVDSLGRYVIRLELTEDQGRKGGGSAVVDAVPPTRDTYVELFWSKFDGSDDPSTFPRVELHALEMPANGRAAWVDCFGDAKERPAWCELETHGANTLMRLHSDPPGRFAIGARYIDDRFQGAPVLCVRTFKNAALMRETCDPSVRRAGAYWQAGVLSEATGTFDAPVVDGGAAAAAPATPALSPASAKQIAAGPADGGTDARSSADAH